MKLTAEEVKALHAIFYEELTAAESAAVALKHGFFDLGLVDVHVRDVGVRAVRDPEGYSKGDS